VRSRAPNNGASLMNTNSLKSLAKSAIRNGIGGALLFVALRPSSSMRTRAAAIAGALGFWTFVYTRYRKFGLEQTQREYEQLKGVSWEAFWRHYNERVPTIEEEFELWGAYHQHRHEMRYDLVADEVRRFLPRGGRVLDVGCGSALVADRSLDIDATYVGFDFGGHHIEYAAKKYADITDRKLAAVFARGDAQLIPFRDSTMDVVVFSEVIEHLLQPELAVWEIARVLKPGGVLIMTTNNASEMPLRTPLSHLFAWIEKALGADHPELISMRPWVWPWPIDRELLPEGSPDVYVPHTHHIQAETRRMFGAAGLDTFRWSSFEFPPPQAALSVWLDKQGDTGQRIVDRIERVAQRTPVIRRMGCHLFMLARKTSDPVSATPPPGVWPGPFSAGN
jgi:ubiquinone/menaquinone biosynthesis C-methylase UbiE